MTYIRVVPRHNRPALQTTFRQALELPGPVLVHARTRKGRGYRPAETDQVGFHGAALPPMTVPTEAFRAEPGNASHGSNGSSANGSSGANGANAPTPAAA